MSQKIIRPHAEQREMIFEQKTPEVECRFCKEKGVKGTVAFGWAVDKHNPKIRHGTGIHSVPSCLKWDTTDLLDFLRYNRGGNE